MFFYTVKSSESSVSSAGIQIATANFFRGIKGALRIPLLSFQFLRRSGCTAKLLCFHIAGGFESHRLHQMTECVFTSTSFRVNPPLATTLARFESHRL